MNNEDHITDLREESAALLTRADRLEAGEELCKHHWSGDPAYECYCTGCDKHLMEVRNENNIPFKEDAYCYECNMTDEEKEAERLEDEEAQKNRELKQLAELKKKHPNA